MSPTSRYWLFGRLCIASLLLGCSPVPDASDTDRQSVATYREQILLAEEPEGALGILELRARMEGVDVDGLSDEHGHAGSADHDLDAEDDQQFELRDVDAAEESAELPPTTHDATAADDELVEPEQYGVSDPDQPVEGPVLETVMDAVVVGKIGGQASEEGVEASDFPWEKGVAAFVIVDPAAEGEAAEHEHHEGEECPFCAKKEIEAQAVVQFNGGRSEPIAIDARELFGLQRDEIVVICGDAQLVGGVLIIDAHQLYIRR